VKKADQIQRLLGEIDQAIACIEELDDRSPISADDLREIWKLLQEVPTNEGE
jgi:hypothetical protein